SRLREIIYQPSQLTDKTMQSIRKAYARYGITYNNKGEVKGMPLFFGRAVEAYERIVPNYNPNIFNDNHMELKEYFNLMNKIAIAYNNATEEKDKSACDIMAERDGEIIKMITRSELPRKKVGDLCKKGEILVSGILELKDDSQEVVKYEAVHADADIYIKRQKAYYHEIPMIYETYEWTGKKKKGIYLKAGRFYLKIADRTKNGWYQIAEEQKMYLTKSFQLPCSIGYITQNQYRKIKKEYTREEVKKLAWHTLQRYEEKLMQKGVQISANNVKIEIDHKTCVSKGFLEIIEKIGEETPVEIPEQPAERTTEDG
ncbi:MAG: hypothetical protein EGR94_09565, partial [Blautia obeum]|nr:hypothetical protein [Blautia obeum]